MRPYFLLLILLFLSTTVLGQINPVFGLKFGSGLSTEKNNLGIQHPTMLGGEIALDFGFQFAQKFYARFDLGYRQTGYQVENPDTNLRGEIIYHNILFSPKVLFSPWNNEKIMPYFYAEISGNYNYKTEKKSVFINEVQDIVKQVEGVSLLGEFGIGAEIYTFLYIEFIYSHSLSNKAADPLELRDQYIGLAIGLHVNRLIR